MKRILTLLAALLPTMALFGQVRGISYTLAPTASYNWFNDASGLDDAFMVGGRLGFGFGEYVELRAIYLQTINQSTNFGGLDLELDDTFLDSDVNLARYGGELKLNLGRGTLLPYLLVGGGIQDIEREGLNQAENIYGMAGLGITLSAADRYTLGLEGKYIGYSFNAAQNLFDDVERAAQNLDLDEFNGEQVGTYSVAANLQFYLGGRRPGQLSDIDQAYMERFNGGISGLSIPLEIGLAQINWDDALAYQDAYLAGASLGFNFGPLVSLRGFYYQGMSEEDLNFDFNDLAIYGGDFRFNLSQARSGLVPFLSVGGGYIDVNADYNQELIEINENASEAESQGFASGGGGVNLRFNDRFVIHGGVRALLTSATDFEDINTTDQITTSWMYNAGLKVNLFGSDDTPSVVTEENLQNQLDEQEARFEARADSMRAANQQEVAQLRDKYETRVSELNKELNDALDEGDVEAAQEIKKERKEAEAVVAEIETRQEEIRQEALREEADRKRQEREEVDIALGKSSVSTGSAEDRTSRRSEAESRIVLRPDELNNLIDRLNRDERSVTNNRQTNYDDQLDRIMERLDEMESRTYGSSNAQPVTSRYYRSNDRAANLDDRIRKLEQQLEEQREDDDSTRKKSLREEKSDREAELEKQIERLEKRMDDRSGSTDDDETTRRLNDMEDRLMKRLRDLEGMSEQDDDNGDEMRQEVAREMADYQRELLSEIESLRDELEDAREEIDNQPDAEEIAEEADNLARKREIDARRQARRQRNMMTGATGADDQNVTVKTRPNIDEIQPASGGKFLKVSEEDEAPQGFFSNITYGGMSGVAGINIGDASFLNLGLRWHYKVGAAQRLEFMPEAYFGLGDPSTFGIFGNVLTPIVGEGAKTWIRPYLGAGVGVMQVEDDDEDAPEDALNFTPAFNLIVGSYIPVGGGRIFADFSTRNFFQNSVISGGYRFAF